MQKCLTLFVAVVLSIASGAFAGSAVYTDETDCVKLVENGNVVYNGGVLEVTTLMDPISEVVPRNLQGDKVNNVPASDFTMTLDLVDGQTPDNGAGTGSSLVNAIGIDVDFEGHNDYAMIWGDLDGSGNKVFLVPNGEFVAPLSVAPAQTDLRGMRIVRTGNLLDFQVDIAGSGWTSLPNLGLPIPFDMSAFDSGSETAECDFNLVYASVAPPYHTFLVEELDITGPLVPSVPDLTGPTAGTVTSEQGSLTSNPNSLTFSWSGFADAESGISDYEVALGDGVDPEAYQAWTALGDGSASQYTFTGPLSDGDYYASVRAINGTCAASTAVVSGAVTVDSTVGIVTYTHEDDCVKIVENGNVVYNGDVLEVTTTSAADSEVLPRNLQGDKVNDVPAGDFSMTLDLVDGQTPDNGLGSGSFLNAIGIDVDFEGFSDYAMIWGDLDGVSGNLVFLVQDSQFTSPLSAVPAPADLRGMRIVRTGNLLDFQVDIAGSGWTSLPNLGLPIPFDMSVYDPGMEDVECDFNLVYASLTPPTVTFGVEELQIVGTNVPNVPDFTGPATGTVTSDEGAATDNAAQLDFSWSGFEDAESGIAEYEVALGDGSDPEAYQAWTSAGSATSYSFTAGAPYAVGTEYTCSVRATNGGCLLSGVADASVLVVASIVIDTDLPATLEATDGTRFEGLAVAASGGSGTIAYEWFFEPAEKAFSSADGLPGVVDAFAPGLVLDPVSFDHEGNWFCRITDAYNSVDSSVCALTVASGVPAAGALGLGVLAAMSALGGALALRRRK